MSHEPNLVEGSSVTLRTGLAAFNWSALGYATGSVLRFLVGVVLARILGPEPFGQVAVALLAIGLGNMLSDFGLSTVIIQRTELTVGLIRSTFTLQIFIGICIAAIWYLLAPAVTVFLHVEEATSAIRALALAVVFSTLGQTSSAILRRQLRMKRVQVIQISSYLVSYVGLGLPLALSGAQVWSLVFAQLAQSLFSSMLMYAAVRHPIIPTTASMDKSIAVAGARVAGSNMVDWGITNIDTLIVGRIFGPVSLGLYNRSYFSAYTPANIISSSIKSVLLPLMSSFQHERNRVSSAFLSIISVGGFVIISMFGSLALITNTFIDSIYGSEWTAAAPILTPLSISMIPLILVSMTSSTLWAINEMKSEFEYQLMFIVIALLIFIPFAMISITTLAWGVALVFFVRFVLLFNLLSNKLDLPGIQVVTVLVRPAVGGAIISAFVFLADHQLRILGIGAIERLSVDIAVGTALVVGVLALIPATAIGSSGMWLHSRLLMKKT